MWQDKLIHYVSSEGIVYLVVADDTVGRRTPFAFLAEVERRVRAALRCHLALLLWQIADYKGMFCLLEIVQVPLLSTRVRCVFRTAPATTR